MTVSVRARSHPFDPLEDDEIAAGARLLRKQGVLADGGRIHGVELVEPDDKEIVLGFDGAPSARRLRFIVADRESGQAEEVVIDPDHGSVERQQITGGQAAITLEEFDRAEALCKADPRYARALAERGIDDPSLVIVDLYGIGAYGGVDHHGRRLARGLSWVCLDPTDNRCAHPVDNLHVIVDLNRMQIVEVEDRGALPIPLEHGRYDPDTYELRGRAGAQNVDDASDADEGDPRFVLVRTKLLVPASRAGLVPRRRLVELLAGGVGAKMTLVCAPTGWGKTSVLAEWAASSSNVRFAWVSLEAGDREPLRFWRYLVAAVATVEPLVTAIAQRRLRAVAVSIADEILPVLANDLADVAGPVVLVLDDYHLVAGSEIDAQLGYLVDRLPRSVHVVVSAQAEPPLRLGRMRAMGDLSELRAEELRFSDHEADLLFNRVHGLDLGAERLATLQRRTEGWVAGLNLAGLSLKQSEDRGRILEQVPAEERYLIDYLWNEVVLGQPRKIRRFLMRTAILERLTPALCDAVTERSDSDEMLRELERSNLFVVALDAGRGWFRYHHFFRALLLGQLQRFAPELVPDLHRRASTWCADHEMMIEAIDHAIAAGDVHWAADELERHRLSFYLAGQATTTLAWIDRLPAEAIDAHPSLALTRAGIAQAVGRLEEVEEWLGRAEKAPAGAPAAGMASSVAGSAALMRSMYRLAVGDVSGAIAWGQHALALEPIQGSREHATAGFFLGVAQFYADPQQAEPLLRRFLTAIPAGDQDAERYFAMALLAEAHTLRGELDAGERLARQALEVAQTRGFDEHPPTEQAHVALGAVLLARGEVDAAEQRFECATTLARRGCNRVEQAHALVWLARARSRQRDVVGAREALDAARNELPELGGSLLEALERELSVQQRSRELRQAGTPLTAAELRLVRLLPADLSYREIAEHLYISVNTVRTHAQRVRNKLGAPTRADAIARARERGLL
jgi:ATP/maltotriose-dependent transcriptional regulator MalT